MAEDLLTASSQKRVTRRARTSIAGLGTPTAASDGVTTAPDGGVITGSASRKGQWLIRDLCIIRF